MSTGSGNHGEDVTNNPDDTVFSQVIILDERIELDAMLCALDEFAQSSSNIELVEVASRMRSQIAKDAGYV